jgi:sigma-E factor negative regulatory protein RseB
MKAGDPSRAGRLSAFVLLSLLLAPLPVVADQYEQARSWLERMAAAMRELTYQGTFIYLRGSEVDTLRITHVHDEEGVRERMVSLSGPDREIVRDVHGVRWVRGDAAKDGFGSGGTIFPEFPAEALSDARARYRFEVGRSGRIAGHNGRRIAILPRDEYRYGYDLWLEERTGLLLRWVLYDAERRSLAKLMFTELRVGDDVDRTELQSATPPSRFHTMAPTAAAGAPAPDVAAGLPSRGIPPGFELAARSRDGAAGDTEHLVFSDGLASVSVYIEPAAESRAVASGLSRLGTTNAWTVNGDGRRVTAIGDVPPVTVRQIGSAFHAADR